MAEKSKQPQTRKRKVYPYIGLKKCAGFIEKLYKKDGIAEVPKKLAWEHMGLDPTKNLTNRASSAMMGFGLLEEKGSTNNKTLQLSALGRIIVMTSDNSQQKNEALQVAALNYQVIKELRNQWPNSLPADDTVKLELLNRQFSERGAGHFARALRETYEFAKLGIPVILEEEQAIENDLEDAQEEKLMGDKPLDQIPLDFEKYEITLGKAKEVRIYTSAKLTVDDLDFIFIWLKRTDIIQQEQLEFETKTDEETPF